MKCAQYVVPFWYRTALYALYEPEVINFILLFDLWILILDTHRFNYVHFSDNFNLLPQPFTVPVQVQG